MPFNIPAAEAETTSVVLYPEEQRRLRQRAFTPTTTVDRHHHRGGSWRPADPLRVMSSAAWPRHLHHFPGTVATPLIRENAAESLIPTG